jgi:drug/metabolite transporter (DMT)-like permease
MIFLAFSILSSASIFVVFKLVDRYKVFTFSAILINYLIACLAGFFLSDSNQFTTAIFQQNWFPVSLITGVLFIVLFYVIGKSTQRAGVAVTTIAGKMSVIFPIAFSIWYDTADILTTLKAIGIVLALVAVFLTVYRKGTKLSDSAAILLPVILFVGMGVIDSFLKFAQSNYVTSELTSVYSTVVFAVAGITGILVLPFNRQAARSLLKARTWFLGVILGIVNFGSIYFLLLALNRSNAETGQQAAGSVTFGINNIGIVVLSVIIGFVVFKERPTRINWIGIALSIFAILILSVS